MTNSTCDTLSSHPNKLLDYLSQQTDEFCRLAMMAIGFLKENDGNLKLNIVKDRFQNETSQSIQNLSLPPGTVILELIDQNFLLLDSDWVLRTTPWCY